MKQIALDIGLVAPPSLDNYYAGPNTAACEHLRLWVREGTRSPVPSYLWGPEGSGKTHLLKAVRESLREQGAAVGWMDASMAEAPAYQESWSAVILDEVQDYGPGLQHAAFTWFVNAQTQGRWVLAAGTVPPVDLKLREDLRTRLGWGHVFALQPLSEPERRAALRKAADARGIFLSDEVMDFMLSRFARDLASQLQLLAQLDGYSLANKRQITIPLLKSMLENL